MRRRLLLTLIPLVLAACTVGPDYQRPEVSLPDEFRGRDPAAPPPDASSLGDLAWWDVFQDETLRTLIRTALAENYDLRVAAARIEEARAQLVETRSNQFPTIDITGQAPFSATAGDRPPLTLENSFVAQGGLSLSFEIDFWGRWRRATEAARADLLATEEARRVVLSTLVSDVASAYIVLRAFDLGLDIARQTLSSRQDSLRLVRLREEGGVVSMADVYQAQTLVLGATREIPDFERQIEQTENFISVLLGRNPGPVPRGAPLPTQIALPVLPTGFPAALLERRPDVRVAEQQLAAATARVGVAKSEFFPRIFLLGSIGVAGGVANSVSFGPMGFFGVGPTLTMPLFNAGGVQAGVDAADARVQAAVARYRQNVQLALREVSDSLIAVRKRQEARREQEALVQVLRDATKLSNLRYDGGVTSYLEVLDNERQLFSASLDLSRTQRDELLAVVGLYRALGGGWAQ